MRHEHRELICFVVLGLICLCYIAGCARHEHNYKAEADKEAYEIIDQKWKPEFGSKANYRISDVTPDSNDIQVEKSVPASGVLTLPQAVALATAHNREYQTEREALYIKALDLRLTRHEFENQWFGGVEGGYNADHNDAVLGMEANIGFNRLLAGGTRISTDLTGVWVDVLTGNLKSGLAAVLSATVTQPLLRGRERRVVLEGLTQAELDTLYQVRSFNRYRKTFIVSVITQYYRLLQLLDQVDNAKNNHDTINWLYERTERLADVGRLPAFELDRIHQEKLQAWDIYLQAENQYKQALDEFKITLSLPTTTEFELDVSEMDVLRATKLSQPEFSESEVVETALCRRLDLANSADVIVDAQRKVFVAADNLKGDLDLIAAVNAPTSRRGNRTTLGWLRKEYGLGAQLDLPLDRVAEQNIYRKALINLNQREREYELTAHTVMLEVRQDYRDLKEAAEHYRVQLEGLQLAKKRFDNTYLLLQYGRASSRRVLRAQEDFFEAQNAATEALIDHAIATLNFYRDTGVLQVRPDGMWEL